MATKLPGPSAAPSADGLSGEPVPGARRARASAPSAAVDGAGSFGPVRLASCERSASSAPTNPSTAAAGAATGDTPAAAPLSDPLAEKALRLYVRLAHELLQAIINARSTARYFEVRHTMDFEDGSLLFSLLKSGQEVIRRDHSREVSDTPPRLSDSARARLARGAAAPDSPARPSPLQTVPPLCDHTWTDVGPERAHICVRCTDRRSFETGRELPCKKCGLLRYSGEHRCACCRSCRLAFPIVPGDCSCGKDGESR